MIHPLKFMLLFSETPYCGPHCLHDRRVTVTQECWARCRVIPSDASPLPKARSIATIGQSASNSLKYHTPDLNYQHRPLSRLHFSSSSSSFFNTINNTKCKSLEQMLREKKDRRRTGEDEEEGKQKEGGGKKHKWRTKQPSWSTFATASQWSHPVFLWGCVWTKRSLKLGYSTVLWHHYGHY